MAFATYAVHVQKPENRLDLAFILLLTTVAFKFTVNSSLPRISYLTTMVTRALIIYHYFVFHSSTKTYFFANLLKGRPSLLSVLPSRITAPFDLAFFLVVFICQFWLRAVDCAGNSSVFKRTLNFSRCVVFYNILLSLLDPIRPSRQVLKNEALAGTVEAVLESSELRPIFPSQCVFCKL